MNYIYKMLMISRMIFDLFELFYLFCSHCLKKVKMRKRENEMVQKVENNKLREWGNKNINLVHEKK